MQRVIVFGKTKKTTKKVAHIARAFIEQGHETLWLNPARIKRKKKEEADKYILKCIQDYQPDIIFIVSLDIPLRVLQQVSQTQIKSVMFYVDNPASQVLPQLSQLASQVDYFLATTSWGHYDLYRSYGIKNPIYMTDACDRHDHKIRYPLLPLWKSDLAFIGAARKDEPRVSLVKKLSSICKVKTYGKNWNQFGIKPTLSSVSPWGYARICGGSKIILGADQENNIPGYWSNRLWLTLGCGGFLLTNYVPGMERYFNNREHLVWYHDEQECISLVKEFLAKPDERKRIARQGYEYVHSQHTFNHFVDRVMQICAN